MRTTCRLCLRLSQKASQKILAPVVIDYASIRADPSKYLDNALKRKSGLSQADMQQLCALYDKRKELSVTLSDIKRKQNNIGKVAIGSKSASYTKSAAQAAGIALRNKVKSVSAELSSVEAEMEEIAWQLPNLTHPEVPTGGYEACKTIRTTSKVQEDSADAFRDHVRVAEALEWADIGAGTSTTGSRWPFLTNEAALLELALTNYAVSVVLSKGFRLVLPPDVVKTELSHRCGFRPRDGEASQTYHVSTSTDGKEDDALVLAGTAEIPLAGYFMNSLHEESQLPAKVMALGRAFRAEAGSRGKESKGLYRVHQFSKVEMFVVCTQEQGDSMLEELAGIQEEILGGLGLPLR
jgi:seryl-tRNA synthetase